MNWEAEMQGKLQRYEDALVNKSPLTTQVGGNHYKDMAIQPIEFIHANNLGYMEGNVVKYVSRWQSKNGLADLRKAKHYIELLIELETNHHADKHEETCNRTSPA
jgi:hypothetical protein